MAYYVDTSGSNMPGPYTMRQWDLNVVETKGLIIITSGVNAPAPMKVVLAKSHMRDMSSVYKDCFHVHNVKCELPSQFNVGQIEGGFNPVDHSITLDSVTVDEENKPTFPEFRLLLTKTTFDNMKAELVEMHWLMDRVILRSMRYSAGLGLMQRQFVKSNLAVNVRRRLRQNDDERREIIRLRHELQSSIRRNDEMFAQVQQLLDKAKTAEGPKLRQLATRSSRMLSSIV